MLARWYQDEAVFSLFDYFEQHTGNPIIAMPTGTGKAFVQADFLRRTFSLWPNQRVMLLTHVSEIIEQNYEELLEIWPTAPAGIYSAGLGQKDVMFPIVFGGIQSIYKNPQIFGHRDLVFIDECHLLGPSDDTMYQKTIAGLKAINPYLKVIGLSATPWRLKQGMLTDEGLFTDICYDITGVEPFNRLIYEGYLCPLIPKRTRTQVDVSNVSVLGGEFNSKQSQEAVEEIIYQAIKETVEECQERRKWLVFASGIENAEHATSILQSFGIPSTCVHSKVKGGKDENRERIRAFKEDEFRALVNANKLTTGFNYPAIDLIVDLQPTCSPGKHVQKYGRGTRPSPETGKINCKVMDFAGNTKRLGPINDPRIPNRPGKGGGDVPIRICEACGVYNHASARFCINCGQEFSFETKLFKTANEDPIMRSDAMQIEMFEVRQVLYQLHEKRNPEGVLVSPPSIKVSYITKGTRMFHHWVCLEHPKLAGKKARDWWRMAHNEEPPLTTYEALKRCQELRVPQRIRVHVNKQYPEVLGFEY